MKVLLIVRTGPLSSHQEWFEAELLDVKSEHGKWFMVNGKGYRIPYYNLDKCVRM